MSILRDCSAALAAALAAGGVPYRANLLAITLADGSATYRFTSWPKDLVIGGHTFKTGNKDSGDPFLKFGGWSLSNKMSNVPSLKAFLLGFNNGFNGGSSIKLQAHNGLLDGASFAAQRVYMPTPGDVTTYGTIDLLSGLTGPAKITGTGIELDCKGKSALLDQNAPRNVIQTPCLHSFCDSGCTLLRASYTASFTVGSSGITNQFIPWASAPANPSLYIGGEITFTSGAASGENQTISNADSTGLTLELPLYVLPAAGDGFTALQGCDFTENSGSGRSCTDRGNTQHFRGFPFVPPPSTGF